VSILKFSKIPISVCIYFVLKDTCSNISISEDASIYMSILHFP
jgi:hypothetical protein